MKITAAQMVRTSAPAGMYQVVEYSSHSKIQERNVAYDKDHHGDEFSLGSDNTFVSSSPLTSPYIITKLADNRRQGGSRLVASRGRTIPETPCCQFHFHIMERAAVTSVNQPHTGHKA